MRYFFTLISSLTTIFFISQNAYAEEVFPPACKPLVIKGESAKLPGGTPRVVMLHNISEFDLWITHSASANDNTEDFSSRLQSNLWSALALEKESFEINCIESKPGHEQQVSCEQTLAVCEWPTVNRLENTQSVLLAGENMPLSALTAYIGRRGFELPQKAQ